MKLNRILITLSLIVSIQSYGQKGNVTTGNLSPIFDISPDNKSIAVAIAKGPISNLYIFSLTEDKLTQLTDDKTYYTRPVYSPHGDKIIFLWKNLEKETSDLCSYDLKKGGIKKLTDGNIYVTEATFLPGGNEIVYCGAGTITNYSPLARKAPHDIDLYSIKIDGGNSKKLTSFHAYEFSNINFNQNGDSLLCKLIIKGVEGIYLVPLSDTVKTKIEAVNNPRPQLGESFYGSPAFSKDNKQISFTAPYQLYTLNMSDRKCVEVWSTIDEEDQAMPIFSRFDGANQKLIFSVLQ